MSITACFVTASVFTEKLYPPNQIRRLDQNGYIWIYIMMGYVTYEFKTRVMRLFWTTAILDPNETVLAQMEQSEILIP